jgi:TRAP-type C4-dicarboxylate transport system permease large subunit
MPPGKERVALDKFLLAGVRPGLLLIGLLVVYCVVVGLRSKVPRSSFDAKEARAALWEAKWELFLPFFLLGGLATGVFSPVTAAAFTAFYVLVVEVFLYKDLSLTRDLLTNEPVKALQLQGCSVLLTPTGNPGRDAG